MEKDLTMPNDFMGYNHMQFEQVADGIAVRVEICQDSRNIHGVVHGGLLSAMADTAAGVAARSDGRDYVTQSMSMSFIRNRSDGTLRALGKIINRGRRVTLVHVDVTDGEGVLLAEGTFNMFCVAETQGVFRGNK